MLKQKYKKLLGGTSTLKSFKQDTMIIPPLSQRVVRGSTASRRPLSWPTRWVQQRRIISVRLLLPKHKSKATQPLCQEKRMLAFLYSILQCRMYGHSNQVLILDHITYLDSKMDLCKTSLHVKDKQHLVFDSPM